MAVSAQDKIMHVANKLGLSSLKYMQASTGAVYDSDNVASAQHTFFENSVQHANPQLTNLNDNRFEVNEALLIETIGFYTISSDPLTPNKVLNLSDSTADDNLVVVFDVIIGNKVVMKDMPIWKIGSPACFATGGIAVTAGNLVQKPRHQVYMEGVGIMIPPQVEFQVNAKLFDFATGNAVSTKLGCYLFGTKVNLNFNTTL